MLTLLKWLGGLILTLSLLILLAVIVLPNIIDPNDYRDELATLVKDKTGRNLKLSGDLEISVFPWLGVRTQDLSLSQPDGIEGDMLSVKTAQLRVKFAPLLRKKIEVDTVVLVAPMIKLVTLKNGTDSFSGLSDSSESAGKISSASEDSSTAAVALVIQGVELSNGTVIIDNRQDDSLTELTDLNLVTGNLIGDSLANIKSSGQMTHSSSPAIGKFNLTANARINTGTLGVAVRNLVAKIEQGELVIDIEVDAISVKEASKIDVTGLTLVLKDPQEIQAHVPVLSANLDSQSLSIESLAANFESVEAVVSKLSVIQFIDKPSATGSLSVLDFNARKLLNKLDIDFKPSDPSVLNSVSLKADFAGSLDGALVQSLELKLDDAMVAGSASVVNYEKPKLKFDVSLNELNLDKYLPQQSEISGAEVDGGEALVVPMALFKDVNANGSFKANSITSGGVALTNIDVLVKSTPGNVSITPKAALYDGKLEGAIVFSQVGEKSSLHVKNNIDLVQLSPLLNDAIDSDMLRGIGTLALDLVVTEFNGMQHNEGTIELRAKDGALSGIDIYNIVGKLNTAADLYSSLSPSEEPDLSEVSVKGDKSDNTEFSDLIGTFHLKDLLMTNDDLKFKGPGFEITGAGQFDLDKERLDYHINLIIQEGISGAAGEGVQNLLGDKLAWLSGKQIPIRCRGALESPVCLPDLKALYSFYVSSKLNNKKADYLQEKLGVKTEEGKRIRTKDILKELLLKEAIRDDVTQESESNAPREIPIGERVEDSDFESDQKGSQSDDAPIREKTKKELKDERKRALLDSIFD